MQRGFVAAPQCSDNRRGLGACGALGQHAWGFGQLSAPGGYHVEWRYVTLDGKWVLVQDSDADHHNEGYATVNWSLVRRSAVDVLCTHPRLTDPAGGPACAPTN